MKDSSIASQRIAAQLSSQIAVQAVEVPLGRQPDQLTPMEIRGLRERRLVGLVYVGGWRRMEG